jgi:hypothetical protein
MVVLGCESATAIQPVTIACPSSWHRHPAHSPDEPAHFSCVAACRRDEPRTFSQLVYGKPNSERDRVGGEREQGCATPAHAQQ